MFRHLALAFFALLALSVASAEDFEASTVEVISFTDKVTSTAKGGKTLTMVAKIKITDFGTEVEDIYCGFKNLNATQQKWGLRNMKTTVQGYKKSINYYLATGQNDETIYWEWEDLGSAAVINRVWTLTAKVALDKKSTLPSHWWAFFCESIFEPVENGGPGGEADLFPDIYRQIFKTGK